MAPEQHLEIWKENMRDRLADTHGERDMEEKIGREIDTAVGHKQRVREMNTH